MKELKFITKPLKRQPQRSQSQTLSILLETVKPPVGDNNRESVVTNKGRLTPSWTSYSASLALWRMLIPQQERATSDPSVTFFFRPVNQEH